MLPASPFSQGSTVQTRETSQPMVSPWGEVSTCEWTPVFPSYMARWWGSPPLSRSTQNTEVCCTTGGGGEGLEQQPGLSKGSRRMWLLPTTSDSIRKLVHESVGTPPLQISPAGLQAPPKLCTHPHKLPNSIVSSLCVPPSGSNECKFLQAATKHTQKATHICSRAQTWASSTTLGKANKRPWATGLTLQDWEKAYKHKDSTQKGNKNCRTSASIAKI